MAERGEEPQLVCGNRASQRRADVPQFPQIAEAVLREPLRLELRRQVAGREVLPRVVQVHGAAQTIAAFLRNDVRDGAAVGELGRASAESHGDFPGVGLRNTEEGGGAAFTAHTSDTRPVDQVQRITRLRTVARRVHFFAAAWRAGNALPDDAWHQRGETLRRSRRHRNRVEHFPRQHTIRRHVLHVDEGRSPADGHRFRNRTDLEVCTDGRGECRGSSMPSRRTVRKPARLNVTA